MAQVTLAGPTSGGRLQQVRDREIFYEERTWMWRVYLVGVGKVGVIGGEKKRDRERERKIGVLPHLICFF